MADTKLIEQSAGHSGEVLQVQSDPGEGQVVAQSANFGYPGNYLFPSNIEATMEKVQVRKLPFGCCIDFIVFIW